MQPSTLSRVSQTCGGPTTATITGGGSALERSIMGTWSFLCSMSMLRRPARAAALDEEKAKAYHTILLISIRVSMKYLGIIFLSILPVFLFFLILVGTRFAGTVRFVHLFRIIDHNVSKKSKIEYRLVKRV